MSAPLSLEDQMTCVRREIAMRRRVYPGQIARGTITQDWAAYQIAVMEAVLATLATLARAEDPQGLLLPAEEGR
jgi:hypothetical protein